MGCSGCHKARGSVRIIKAPAPSPAKPALEVCLGCCPKCGEKLMKVSRRYQGKLTAILQCVGNNCSYFKWDRSK